MRRRSWCVPAIPVLLTATALTLAACGGGDESASTTQASGVDQGTEDGPQPTSAGEASGTDGNSVEGGPNPTVGASSGSGQQSVPDSSSTSGQITLTGTVVDMTPSELMDISEINTGGPSPNGEPDINGYLVLQLDSPQQISARKSGAPGTQEDSVSYVSLATPNGSESSINWSGYVGQHVTVTTTPEGLWFPSDTGLPLGMARLSEGTVL